METDLDGKNRAALILLQRLKRPVGVKVQKRRGGHWRKSVGKTRIRIAEMISTLFNCECIPEDIWIQNPVFGPADCARWGVDLTINGAMRNVHSWDTMTTIVKAGRMVRVHKETTGRWGDDYQVCAAEEGDE